MFQTRLPAAVSSPNLHTGMRVTPAGIEMRLRKMGSIRPKKTALPPWRSNHATVRSMSSGCISGTFAASARSRAAPSQRPRP